MGSSETFFKGRIQEQTPQALQVLAVRKKLTLGMVSANIEAQSI